jgi:ABC-type uncharacterized transport system substrate-binding protein
LPSIYTYREQVLADGLISYATNYYELFRHAATVVDKILKGAKPSNLPVEQPTKIELVINLKTAKTIGLTVPPTLCGAMSAIGPKPTSQVAPHMSAFGGKADMAYCSANVRL